MYSVPLCLSLKTTTSLIQTSIAHLTMIYNHCRLPQAPSVIVYDHHRFFVSRVRVDGFCWRKDSLVFLYLFLQALKLPSTFLFLFKIGARYLSTKMQATGSGFL